MGLAILRGPELVVNGDFAGGVASWTAVNGANLSEAAGVLRIANVGAGVEGAARQAVWAPVAGTTYEVTLDKIAGDVATGAVTLGGVRVTLSAGTGRKSYFITAINAGALTVGTNNTVDASWVEVDNVSVREML